MTLPTPKKGKVPNCDTETSQAVQQKFDKLEELGVITKPERYFTSGSVVHTSLSFLVKNQKEEIVW